LKKCPGLILSVKSDKFVPRMISLSQLHLLKQKAAYWANQFDIAMVLDSNECEHALNIGKFELLIAVGVKHELTSKINAFEELKTFKEQYKNEWIFGWLTYDLKNQLEKLESKNEDNIGFESMYFFVPQKLIAIDSNFEIVAGGEFLQEILNNEQTETQSDSVKLEAKVSKEKYIENVNRIRTHIENGDVYELNYCVEFFANKVNIDPASIYNGLKQRSPVPFGCFVKHYKRYVIGASPERFITKIGNKLYSQPIKGTARRLSNKIEDEQQAYQLLHSEKERAENLMIVDLVRNDLARTAETGSVKVDELFGIYSFPQVHQMISTVSSTLNKNENPIDAIKHAFPMGSMTGAPKIMAMKLIEQYEETKRGLYSGAIGYFGPNGDFDFNVVIRSIQYNKQTQYLNFEVGGAITYDSVAEDEYEECLLKSKAMKEVLGGV
jgi:para-aminobenzoate synthetase component 1